MLNINGITKQYKTGDLVQTALDDVSLSFRDNEFVAILGPSGSGKTTLLNVVGGLDRYDSGDLEIDGVSTKKYKDRDWDTYRNHSIGFVFQSYNLIPHQSVLANVELALTISGVSKKERKNRAKEALKEVGLGDQTHKKPNQLSGGQMQRVAIARALVNNPSILLADEPTGALDSQTSVQVMELLKKVANDRLVIMVTHNPELAEQYANRIVKLKDGKIIEDTNPYTKEQAEKDAKEKEEKLSAVANENAKNGKKQKKQKRKKKASMSFLTSLSLSFNNLRTKKGRTILTSFAGSIGIIGIALILSLSNGVNAYIDSIQKDTMTSYPISIKAQSFDFAGMMEMGRQTSLSKDVNHAKDKVYSNTKDFEMAQSVADSLTENNLTAFKEYLDDPSCEMLPYLGENGISYGYDTKFDVYSYDDNDDLVNTDGSTLADNDKEKMALASMNMTGSAGSGMGNMSMGMSGFMNRSNFSEIMSTEDGKVSNAISDKYDLLYGELPKSFDEIVLVTNENNEISASILYELGFLPTEEYKDTMKKLEDDEEIDLESKSWSYEDICKKEFYLIPECDYYEENNNGTYSKIEDEEKIKDLLEDAQTLKISGIIRPNDEDVSLIDTTFGYTKALTAYLIDYTNDSAVVKAQKDDKDINILNGMRFEPENDDEKIEDAKTYISNMGVTDKANLYKNMLAKTMAENAENENNNSDMAQMYGYGYTAQMPKQSLSESDYAALTDNYLENADDDVLLDFYDKYVDPSSYKDNLEEFGVVSFDTPSSVDIYADSFEDKDKISECIENYNSKESEENQITYTDTVALLMSSVTTIVNVISYVLIAFVAVSLIVSSIMIGIITYISVLERTKEIGILRALGASKRNIASVFRAETVIVGLCSGLIGIGITLLLLIPGNAIIHLLVSAEVSAYIPIPSAVLLIVLSMFLTLIGGLIPAKKAAKKDPVTALRTE